MFLDWQNQHCENDYTTHTYLKMQCKPYQTTNGIFHRTRTKNSIILGLPWCTVVKSPPANAGDTGSNPDLGRSNMWQSN